MEQQQNKPPSAYFCVTAYRQLTTATFACIIRDLIPFAQRHQVQIAYSGNDALISRTRSRICTNFLYKSDRDVLIWTDADLSWRPGDLERLTESAAKTRGIVGGVVAKRGFGLGIASRITSVQDVPIRGDKLIEADYVGAAFMAIHRDALMKIQEKCDLPWVKTGYIPFCGCFVDKTSGEPEYLSEDWALCKHAHEAGVPVMLDCYPEITHHGDYGFTVQDSVATRPESALILCAGSQDKWHESGGEGFKHLAPIDGQPNLHRTVGMLRSAGISDITIVTHDKELEVKGCKTFAPPKRSKGGSPVSILATRDLWKPGMLILYGDTIWSPEGITAIQQRSNDKLRFFGRTNASQVTGSPCGDLWAICIGKPGYDWSRLESAMGFAVTFRGEEGSDAWFAYRYLEGFPPDKHIVDQGGTIWIEQDDWTDDIDFYPRYQEYIKRMNAQCPT